VASGRLLDNSLISNIMLSNALPGTHLYLHPAQRDALRRYENLALPVFRRYGGRFELQGAVTVTGHRMVAVRISPVSSEDCREL
jgi:hypothetical protein